jgi:hypothetical protein
VDKAISSKLKRNYRQILEAKKPKNNKK